MRTADESNGHDAGRRPHSAGALREFVAPLVPPSPPRRFWYPGRKRVGGREALTGSLFVLKAGIRRADVPAEMGCGLPPC